MKIIKETSNLMVLNDWTIVTFFVGGLFCLLGVYLLFSSGLVKDKPLSSLPSILFFLVGLFSILKAKRTTVSLDKSMNKLFLERKTIINKKEEEYRLDEIKEIELQQQIYNYAEGGSKYGIRRQGYYYNLVLVLNNGQTIFLPTSGKLMIMGKQIGNSEEQIGKKISEFLNIPFKNIRPPTLDESISALKEVVREEMQKRSKQ